MNTLIMSTLAATAIGTMQLTPDLDGGLGIPYYFYGTYKIEVCKMAGDGVTPGTVFDFVVTDAATGYSETLHVTAQTDDPRNCQKTSRTWLQVATFPPQPSPSIEVKEVIPVGYSVDQIYTPSNVQTSNLDLANGSINVMGGPTSIFPPAARRVVFVNKAGSTLKICKIAGNGVVEGTPFDFSVNGGASLTIPAGPAPDGYCKVVNASFHINDSVHIEEMSASKYEVSDIQVTHGNNIKTDLAGKTVDFSIADSVTEASFTNEANTRGFLEICKVGGTGDYVFDLSTGDSVTVGSGVCSKPIEVDAGDITITELPQVGGTLNMVGCETFPATHQLTCDPTNGVSVVHVEGGDVSTQTIATIENQ